jgi:hypothetical protein
VGTAIGTLGLAAVAWLLWRHGLRTGRRAAQNALSVEAKQGAEPYAKPEHMAPPPVGRHEMEAEEARHELS